MPRPTKCRKVCCLPKCKEFSPHIDQNISAETIVMTVDEYETIRLIDYQGFSQEECGEYMHVARATVQLIYNRARKKIADVLVNGAILRIEGGDYSLCSGNEKVCACGGCQKHRCPHI